jgi:hypothetical protein
MVKELKERRPSESQPISKRRIDELVRKMAQELRLDLSEEIILEVIEDLVKEWENKHSSE